MAITKQKGDLAEMKVAADLLKMGHRIALPFGEDWDFDLILYRQGELERVQVKHARSDGRVIPVRCYTQSLTNGKVKRIKRYTEHDIDLLAVYDATTDRCYYVPSQLLGEGRRELSLRIAPTLNGQAIGIRNAEEFTRLPPRHEPPAVLPNGS